ncbi:unnamed protein product [Parnassius apollo]|uniref:(apollo) hypothetical protein n=1 Tax=Parnassius apollo TaxID=110799 RepID=A0A8S3WTY2_PARAO|nr:unnamed protein product [Parnassius apollo]
MNLDPLDCIDQPSRNSVDEESDRLGQPGTPIQAIPVEVPAFNDINELTNQVPEFENQNQIQPKMLLRKRKGDPSEWRDNKNKKLKNSGQAYEGARNKKHHEKKNILSNCACKKGCALKFNTEDRSRQLRQKQMSETIESIELKPAYDKPLPIKKALYNDLLTRCKSQAIPYHYQPFYRNLSFCDIESGHDEDSD